jgi:hypothetical protein
LLTQLNNDWSHLLLRSRKLHIAEYNKVLRIILDLRFSYLNSYFVRNRVEFSQIYALPWHVTSNYFYILTYDEIHVCECEIYLGD